jgi:hypothetical protein
MFVFDSPRNCHNQSGCESSNEHLNTDKPHFTSSNIKHLVWERGYISFLLVVRWDWVHLVRRPPAPDERWLWSSRWNENWQGKPKDSEKTCPSATLSTTNLTWPDPERRSGWDRVCIIFRDAERHVTIRKLLTDDLLVKPQCGQGRMKAWPKERKKKTNLQYMYVLYVFHLKQWRPFVRNGHVRASKYKWGWSESSLLVLSTVFSQC